MTTNASQGLYGSTPTQALFLRPCARCLMTIISAWWDVTSSKQRSIEAKLNRKTRKQRQLLSQLGFRLVHTVASPPVSAKGE